MIKLSIVVPVYNSSKYLGACLDSLLQQTYENLEVIIVDDGSTDESGDICDRYAAQDPRIKVTHTRNSGTSSARNLGMQLATGDYLTFIDNDDFWYSDTCLASVIEQLEAQHPDVLMHMNLLYDNPSSRYDDYSYPNIQDEIHPKDGVASLSRIISEGLMTRAAWNKVISVPLLRENDITFPIGKRNEDSDWTGKLILCARSFAWHDQPFYVYRKGHEYAQTSKPLEKSHVTDLSEILLARIPEVDDRIEDPAARIVYYSYWAYPYSVWMAQQAVCWKSSRDVPDYGKMKDLAYVLRGDLDPSVRKVAKLYHIAGFGLTTKILSVYLKRHHPEIL